MDILSIKPNTITVHIKHPSTREPIGLAVECTSFQSDEVKATERQIKNKRLRSGRNTLTAEAAEADAMAVLGATIVGWTWAEGLTLGGLTNPPLTASNKATLLSVPWIAKQIDEELGDEAAFFRASETS
ncbi:hypothetical protein ACLBXM_20085 [Xanthobacteraceae bacterium A53D]